MGRFLKSGVDYFTLDCNLEDKVKLVEAEFGIKGFGVIIKLWQKIYSEMGYYAPWSRQVALLFAHDCGVGIGVVEEVVKASLREGVFDQKLYDKYSILTSAGIQKRYAEATRKREFVKFEKAYLLIAAPKNAIYSAINDDNSAINGVFSAESKGKEIKVFTTTDRTHASVHTQEKSNIGEGNFTPPTFGEVFEFFSNDFNVDRYGDPVEESEKFIAFNAKRGWDCLPNWELTAELWAARIREHKR